MAEFHEMKLDDRILKAIAKLGWAEPTPIQAEAIPRALEGKDILARARTGSGKTAAFAIPIIQKILEAKQTAKEQVIRALILTPSKELCNQAYRNLLELTSSCSRDVKCLDISPQLPLPAQRPMLMERPDILVGTPARVLAHIRAGNLELRDSMEMLVIDEADLTFSFGYEQDIKELLKHFPKIYQAFLTSATMSQDVKALKKMVLHNTVTLQLKESELPDASQLTQYRVLCEEGDKFALLAALLKLQLIRGKTIIFVKNVERCYKLKLFLQFFGIPTCVLNSELPMTSRCHIVNEFNEGRYSYIIASDETMLFDPEKKPQDPNKKKRKKDKEYSVSRGIDFQNVTNIVNFDFPKTVEAYIHRVGRTARGDNQGTALSLIAPSELPKLEAVEQHLVKTSADGEVLKPYKFDMDQIQGFKYRSGDAMRAVTRAAIRNARLKEIEREMLNSEKLKSHFEDNPKDYHILRHDKEIHTLKSQPELKHVPDYIVPETLKNMMGGRKRKRGGAAAETHRRQGPSHSQKRFKKQREDPLKSFQFAGFSKKGKRK